MNKLEEQLLTETTDGSEPRLRVRTRTRIDTGCWWRRSRAWLCVMDDALVILAVARRRFLEQIALTECSGSHYCPASGELVIEPVEQLTFSRFRVGPREALDLLAAMGIPPVEHKGGAD